jgi:hypothetical protein
VRRVTTGNGVAWESEGSGIVRAPARGAHSASAAQQ